MHIFVSYARREPEAAFVRRLTTTLLTSSLQSWVDVRNLEPGLSWPVQIDMAIREAFAFVLVLSPAGVSSEYVAYEWAYALGADVPVLPLLFESEGQLHPRLKQVQFLDCIANEQLGFERAVEWLLDKEDPNFRTVAQLRARLRSSRESNKIELLRELVGVPGNRGRQAAVDYADQAVEILKAATSREQVEREVSALVALHYMGVPGIKDRLVALNFESVDNRLLQPVVGRAVAELVLRGRGRGV